MLLSEYINILQKKFEKYGDAPVFELGEWGEHQTPYVQDVVYHFNYNWNEKKQDMDEEMVMDYYLLDSY